LEKQAPAFLEQNFLNKRALIDTPFVHLHNHTQFSVLQSTINCGIGKAAQKIPRFFLTVAIFRFCQHKAQLAPRKKTRSLGRLVCEDHKSPSKDTYMAKRHHNLCV
jgi:hypothetical protein